MKKYFKKEKNKDLAYWKGNAEEDYNQVPISVLRYITELEEVVKNCSVPDLVNRREQLECKFCGADKGLRHGYTSDGEPCPMDKTA